MRNTLLTIVICVFTGNISSQEAISVKGKGYDGYIFDKEHFVWLSIENQKERYTPTKEDIVQVEKLLKDSMNYILKNQLHSHYYKPPINKRTLKKYRRQYVGFLTKDNNVVIWINFAINNKEIGDNEFFKDIISVYDGGSDYWSIFVNLTKKELFGMEINGIS
jgi:hypothetical protein